MTITLYSIRHFSNITLITGSFVAILSGCDQVRSKPSCSEYFAATDFSGYQMLSGGMALQLSSNTVWYRCPAGQFFRENICHGEPLLLNWAEANSFAAEFSENSDFTWRLPSNSEFQAITTNQCVSPAVNTNVFPQLPIANFWTFDQANIASSRNCLAYSFQGNIACREVRSANHVFMLVATP